MSTRILSVLTLFVLLAVMITAGIQPQSAPAGTNGQQLSTGTGTEMAPRTFFYYVVVMGRTSSAKPLCGNRIGKEGTGRAASSIQPTGGGSGR